MGPVIGATAPDPRRRSASIALRYVQERQRRRWSRAATTPGKLLKGWGEPRYGLIRRQHSSPVPWHRNRHPSLPEPPKTPARGPLYFFNRLLDSLQEEVRCEGYEPAREGCEGAGHEEQAQGDQE